MKNKMASVLVTAMMALMIAVFPGCKSPDRTEAWLNGLERMHAEGDMILVGKPTAAFFWNQQWGLGAAETTFAFHGRLNANPQAADILREQVAARELTVPAPALPLTP